MTNIQRIMFVASLQNSPAMTSMFQFRDATKEADKEMIDSNNKQSDNAKKNIDSQVAHAKKASGDIKNALQIGFSMHIIRMFAMPLVSAFQSQVVELLDKFGEFDKAFVDYAAKSKEFGTWLSKNDFADIAVGQTFAMIDAAEAAERFAASGVDVSKNVDALTDVLQVATIADVDYDTAANSVIRTMNAFHMSIEQSARITDAMVNAANASTAELSDMAQWFEFAASGASSAGLEVEQFAAYLGILSSTGMPNTGAAIRQLFLQLSKEDVRERFKESFGITDEYFNDFNKFIEKMQEIVDGSKDQAEAVRQITTLLGGKVTSQQALNNLLKAEPELWNQVMVAVQKTGATQSLYEEVTNNVADAMVRIRNAIDMIQTQMGSVFIPLLKIAEFAIINVAKALSVIPDWIKGIIGGGIVLLVAALSTALIVIAGLVGSLFILKSAVEMLSDETMRGVLSFNAYITTIKKLSGELLGTIAITRSAAAAQKSLVSTILFTGTAFEYEATAMKSAKAAMSALSGIMFGFMISQAALEKGLFGEARLVSLLTSLWVSYQMAKAGALLGPVGVVAGVGAGALAYAAMNEQITNAEIQARVARRQEITGIGGTTVIDASTKYFVENGEFTSDGTEIFASFAEDATDSPVYTGL